MGSRRRPGRRFAGKGQSTLEYFLVMIVVIAAVVAAANAWIKPAVDQMLAESSEVIRDSATKVRVKLGL